ncbi:GNAT family N-acetyltransferase [Effusibacillus consociatus]|uniref:GNAT family N-acetyltransferase n=1 Tax=Effusibacillus consociatus TaxID=1117041 RepID=A0ABV9Q0E7_9BACL
MGKVRPLSYRSYQSTDDRFIIDAALLTMKKIFEESTGCSLTEDVIREQLNANETTRIIEQNGKPIGYYGYTVYPSRKMYWSALILIPTAQHRGLGNQVVRQVEKEALAKGVRVIEGHVQTANKRALSFWIKNGFQTVGSPFQGMIEIRKKLQRINEARDVKKPVCRR